MQTKEELKTKLEEINKQISQKNNEIVSLREEGIKIVGKIELLTEQASVPVGTPPV